MLQGRQTGILWTNPGKDGIEIVVHEGGYAYDYVRIKGGQREEGGFASYKDVYDERQGCDVPGVVLLDRHGAPTGETFKLSDFHMSGNLTWHSLF
jgi:hypothetical protein